MQESGFFTDMPLSCGPSMGEATLLHSSQSGPCELYRVMKDGCFRVYKCLKLEHRGDPVYETMLRKEYQTGYGLDHLAVCRTYSFSEVPGLGNCIEMEWVDGRTLDDFMQEKPDRKSVERIFAEICDALGYLHRKQVTHRDLKPSNILICHHGDHVRLIDFGVSDTDSSCTLKGPAGTVRYAAPEVIAGGTGDARADIWSLGVIMSQYGLFPKIVSRCMRRDPDMRYGSAGEIGAAIARRRPRRNIMVFAIMSAIVAIAVYQSFIAVHEGRDSYFKSATEAIENANSLNKD